MAGLAVVLGALMLVAGIVKVDVVGIVLGLVLVVGSVLVLKRPRRAR